MKNHNRATVILRYLTRRAALVGAAWALLLAAPAALAQMQGYGNSYGSSRSGSSFGSSFGSSYGNSGNSFGNGYGYGGGGYGGGGYGGNGYGGGGYGNSGSSFGGSSFGNGGSSFGGSSFGNGGSSFGGSSFGNGGSSFGGSSFGNSGSGSGFGGSGSSFGSSSSAFGSRYGNNQNGNYQNGNNSSDYQSQNNRSNRNQRNQRNQNGQNANGQPQGARAQAKTNIAKRKGGVDKKSGGGTAIGLPPIKADPKLFQDTVFMSPSFMDVAPGDRFMTTIAFYNSQRHDLTEYDLWVHYNPAQVEPIWADTQKTQPYAKGEIESNVWRERGYIQLHARLLKTPKGPIVAFADLYWRAKAPTLGARIELAGPAGKTVAVYQDKANLVSGDHLQNSQKVSAEINILPQEWDEPGMRTADQVAKLVGLPPLGKLDRLRLAIVAPQAEVATGQIGVANVCLINPKGLPFDSLKMVIRYDPEEVTILDADQDNFIADGLNIFDGDFHEKFPFDGHIRNLVNPERGTIEYEVCSVMGAKTYPTGVFARIVYRMNRSVGKASFRFQAQDPVLKIRSTDVTNYGTSLLGSNVQIALDALHGAEVAAKPAELTPEPQEVKTTAMARE